jgi:potassium-dependent mechanosensitive channel
MVLALIAMPASAQTTPQPDNAPAPTAPQESAQTAPQPAPEPPANVAAISAAPDLTAARIQAKIDEIEARKDIAQAQREQALALYRKALGELEAAAGNQAAAAKFQKAIADSPRQTADVKQQLDVVLNPKDETVSSLASSVAQLPLNDVEQELNTRQGEIAKLKAELSQLDARLKDIASRPTTARAEQTDEKLKLDDLAESSAVADKAKSSPLSDARLTSLSAERLARSAKVNLLEQEIISLPARQALVAASHDLVAAKLKLLERQLPILEARLNDLRQSDAAQRQAQAETVTRELAGQHPILKDYAKATSELRQKQTDITKAIERTQAKQAEVDAENERVSENLSAAQQIVEIGSVGSELGEYLREMRAQLPILSQLREDIHDRDTAIVDARLQRLNIDQRRRTLVDAKRAADRILATAGLDPSKDWNDLRPMLEPLMTDRRDALTRLSEVYALQIEQLAKFNAAKRELLSETEQFSALLNNRLLWLPSSAPLGTGWLDQIRPVVAWLSKGKSWKFTAVSLGQRIANLAIPSVVILALCAIVAFGRRRLLRRLGEIAESVGKLSTDNLLLTPRAVLITVLISLPVPLLLGYAGWLLERAPQASEFAAAVGNGLTATAAVYLVIRFVQNLCVPFGVFRSHFEWGDRECRALSRNLGRFVVVVLPAAFLMGMIDASNSQGYRDGLGRLAFLVGAVACTALLLRILSPRKRIVGTRISRDGASWATRGIWYPLICATPLALAALAVTGYYDSASELQMRLAMSIAMGLIAMVAYAMSMREVLVARRRLEVIRAQDRRKRAREAAATRAEDVAVGDAAPLVLDDAEVDVASISQQTRTLLRLLTLLILGLGLWLIWKPLLPALGLLDQVPLWTQTIATDAGTKVVPVTLFNLLIGLAVAAMTIVAAHNLPGLLEFTLLQRLAIDSGTRYAITAISRYCIVILGLVIAFESIGADWSQLQWIIAALGVGVGFGLQEIVANFVSGLIILFERPVRVGDTVTIGDLDGTVSRIQIRATSITDWDNKEIIVPNKSLITDKVVNWTLTEPITRLLIKVGVAYGTETDRAQDVIMGVVKANPLALTVPPPSVLFLGFGDSSLDFEIRVFVALPSHRLRVLHELHTAIYQALRDNKIEIPFPQRDLHLKLGEVAEAAQVGQVRRYRGPQNDAAE